jgi:hypothetical protein
VQHRKNLRRGVKNLGHEHVLTTFTSYGNVAQHRQDDILERMVKRDLSPSSETQPCRLLALDLDRLDRLERMIAELRPNAQRH